MSLVVVPSQRRRPLAAHGPAEQSAPAPPRDGEEARRQRPPLPHFLLRLWLFSSSSSFSIRWDSAVVSES